MKLMMRFFFAVSVLFLFGFNSSAEAIRGSLECEFTAKKLVFQGSKDTFNHGIFYANIGGNDVLLILCHARNVNGRYAIKLNGQLRSDYSTAVSELIDYWNMRGNFRNIKNVDIILLGTCYGGYASNLILPKYVSIPKYGIPMVTVADYKGKLFYNIGNSYGGMVNIQLYTDRKRREPASFHSNALSNFFGGFNVRDKAGGYRAVNEEIEIPADAVEL